MTTRYIRPHTSGTGHAINRLSPLSSHSSIRYRHVKPKQLLSLYNIIFMSSALHAGGGQVRGAPRALDDHFGLERLRPNLDTFMACLERSAQREEGFEWIK